MSEKSHTLIFKDRLKWRARRGMRELDEVLTSYLARCLDDLNTQQLSTLERFLEQNDMNLLSWLTGKTEPNDKQFAKLVRNILESHQ